MQGNDCEKKQGLPVHSPAVRATHLFTIKHRFRGREAAVAWHVAAQHGDCLSRVIFCAKCERYQLVSSRSCMQGKPSTDSLGRPAKELILPGTGA